eukprot:4385350-Pleurochrysis_carterae.AAC.1
MSASAHPRSPATLRSASRSTCLRPGNLVSRDDLSTGTHLRGSAQSHATPRAHGCMSSWPMTR